MLRRHRFVVVTALAIMPTPIALVAPWRGSAVEPHPVAATLRTYALKGGPEASLASGVSGADDTEARRRAGGKAVAVQLASSPVAVPDDLAVVGVTWEGTDSRGASVQYRALEDGVWGRWQFAPVDDDHRPEPAEERSAEQRRGGIRGGSSPVVLLGVDQVQVRLLSPTSGNAPAGAQLSVIDPGSSSADATAGVSPGAAMAAAQQPYIYTRKQWGADESLRDQSGPTYAEVKAAFVHHTVGTNSYSSAQVPGIIRGIYEYHVRSQGWADVGYNFFVDRFGRTWEGRYGGIDKAVQGAHTYGVNDDAFGVAVLGNYQPDAGGASSVPSAVTHALAALIAWKAQVHGFDPTGTSVLDGVAYRGVNGHRDAKDNSTACPGDTLYKNLPAVRTEAGAATHGARMYVDRWSGSDRYGTAATISRSTFPEGARIAFVATGADFPDALAGGPAGAVLKGPVLLTEPRTLPAATYNELKRLAPSKVVILGGTGAISDAVKRTIAGAGFVTERWAAADRYDTAVGISSRTFPGGAQTAYVAASTDFPDALAAGPAGGTSRGPVLLTGRTSLASATATELKRLAPTKVVVVGGTGVISSTVAQQITQATGVTPERWAGSNRYSTAAQVSRHMYAAGSTTAFVTTGVNFPDGLAGGPAGGLRNGPLLLTGRDAIPTATADELKRLGPDRIIVLGGSGVVSTSVEKQLAGYLR